MAVKKKKTFNLRILWWRYMILRMKEERRGLAVL